MRDWIAALDNDQHHQLDDHSNIHDRDDVPCVHRPMYLAVV